MSNLKDVVKSTLLRLQKSGQIATPKAYQEAFCIEAKNAGITLEECQWQVRWMQKFDPKTKKQIQNHPIKTPDEFIALLAGILARTGSANDRESPLAQKELLKILLHLHVFTPEVSELAHETLLKLEALNDPKVLALLKDRWSVALKSRTDQGDTNDDFARILDPFLAPSISLVMPAEVLEMRSVLKNTPSALFDKTNREKLKLALLARIATDKQEFTKKSAELGEVIEVLLAKLSALAQKGAYHQDEVSSIYEVLQGVNFDPKSLENAKNRLTILTQKLTEYTQELHCEAKERHSEVAFLGERVHELARTQTTEKSPIDPLTTAYTRHYMEEALKRLEARFLRYESGYSVVFFDIDYFAKINAQYGREAGDKVLATFGRLLRESVRTEDVVVRYEGEKFVVLLPEMGNPEAWQLAEKMRILVEQSIFVYQDLRIRVSVSGGVAHRGECKEKESLLNLVASRLYEAKKGGRNQICPSLRTKGQE
ncbi:MAG: GGDEF domain-containing protein [Wolinella sp.]